MKQTTYALLFCFYCLPGYCQTHVSTALLKSTTRSDSIARNYAAEGLYFQFDKPNYAIDDTIWLKAWLFNSPTLLLSAKSRLLHVDIANDSGKLIKQYLLPVQAGTSWGSIVLDNKTYKEGTYILRAYTNWMRNFGDSRFFYKRFFISGAGENNLIINANFNNAAVNGAERVSAALRFSDMNQVPFAVEPLTVTVVDGQKRLYKQKLQTGVDGTLNVSFAVPKTTSNLALVAESAQNDKHMVIPVVLNRDENADVQFLPEGGNLVAGLPMHIGVKAIGEDGRGVNVSGVIINRAQKIVAGFQELHNGIGSFDLFIEEGESYFAKITFPGGVIKEYPLPAVKNTGIAISVRNPLESDSITVSVAATNDMARSGGSYFLIGKARGIVCYAAVFDFRGDHVRKKIAKRLFPSGITHFMITTPGYQPLNERLVYIDHHDNLDIQFNADKPEYGARESVTLKIKVTDHNGNPVSGNFSLAVTDDAQVKTDTLDENLISRMLLTSDLKGYIETPGYYFSAMDKEKWAALDNLLLTQGWTGYDWQQMLNPRPIVYQPEQELKVKGQVTNVFNKPVKGGHVLLFSKSPAILMDTVTDKNGRFIFDRFPKVDTPVFILKAVNKNGKSFNVNISVDEVTPPDFVKPAWPPASPWYVNSDSTLLTQAKTTILKQRENFSAGSHVLKEVNIKAKKTVKDSQNLNGPGNADFVLDEKDLEKAGKKTWLQLLQENVSKFKVGTLLIGGSTQKAKKDLALFLFITDGNGDQVPSFIKEWYFIGGVPVKFIIDGLSVYKIYTPAGTAFTDVTDYLTSHSAEDIKGVEVNISSKYTMRYIPAMANIVPSDIAFVEITTRSGHGPAINNTPGMYLYKSLPISLPSQFYKPQYTITDTARHLQDLRSTIDWEPNVITDANGEAIVRFYTADKPTYTVIIEGTDMNGGLGYKTGRIVIGENKKKHK